MPGGYKPCPFPLGGTPETGWTAEQQSRFCADLVAAGTTVPRAWISYDAAGAVYTLVGYRGMNGVGSANAPTFTYNGVGDLELEWVESYEDEYGIRRPWQMTKGKVTANVGFARVATVVFDEPHIAHVYLFTSSTGAAVNADFTLRAW